MSNFQSGQSLDDLHVFAESQISFNLPPGIFDGSSVGVFIKPQSPQTNYQIYAWQVVVPPGSTETIKYPADLKTGKYTVTLSDSDSFFVQPEVSFNLVVHEHDTISAGAGDDDIQGSASADTLSGGSGEDRLSGGKGRDVLQGGVGKDIFVFDTKPNRKSNVDTITDFSVKDDTIQLDHAVFAKLNWTGTLKKSYFKMASEAKDRNDYIIYDPNKGILSYDVDGSGAKSAVTIAKLDPNLKLTHKDFFVI